MKNKTNYEDWKKWNSNSFGKTSKFEQAYFDNVSKLVKLKKHSKILEIGFGNGSFMAYANNQNYEYVGVETNQNLVKFALEKNFLAYDSLQALPRNGKYELIALFDVIEHIREDEIVEFLKALSNYLEDSGSIFLKFPNGSSPFGLDNQHGDVTHCSIITLSKLNFWCLDAGLKIKFHRGSIAPFIFKHNFLKLPSRIIKLILHKIFEKLVRLLFIQSKGVLSSNLEVVIKKNES